jgi:hypothetical protein
MKVCIFTGTQIFFFCFFICHFVFRRQPADFFFSKKICQIRGGQNNKYDINNTWIIATNKHFLILGNDKLSALRESLRLFMHHFLLKSKKEKDPVIKSRVESAENALLLSKNKNFWEINPGMKYLIVNYFLVFIYLAAVNCIKRLHLVKTTSWQHRFLDLTNLAPMWLCTYEYMKSTLQNFFRFGQNFSNLTLFLCTWKNHYFEHFGGRQKLAGL